MPDFNHGLLEEKLVVLNTDASVDARLRAIEEKIAVLNSRPQLDDKLRTLEDKALVMRTAFGFVSALLVALGISGGIAAKYLFENARELNSKYTALNRLAEDIDKVLDKKALAALEHAAPQVLNGKVPKSVSLNVSTTAQRQARTPDSENAASCPDGTVVWKFRHNADQTYTLDCGLVELKY